MKIAISRRNCPDPTDLASREWLDANGGGGYASGTVAGPPTRKYHGLLVANLPAPASGRHVLVTAVEECFDTGNGTVLLSGVACAGTPRIDPPCPTRFTTEPIPTWTYRVDALEVERAVLVPRRRDAVLIRYRFRGKVPAGRGGRLTLGPLLAFRRNHALAHRNPYLDPTLDRSPNGYRITPYPGMPSLFCRISAQGTIDVAAAPEWREGVFYRIEQDRGYPASEDLFRPGTMSVECAVGDTVFAAFATERIADIETLFQDELDYRGDALDAAREAVRRLARDEDEESLRTALLSSAESFMVRVPPDRPTVLAGYHWFEDWGRDTLIALPGLAFVRGRLAAGLEVLQTFVDYERDGRIPNYIGPDGAGAYNSVDAPLWLFWTLQQYLFHGGSPRELRRFWPTMKRILDRLAGGSREDGIGLHASGLLHSGTPSTQLTWMDAAVDGIPVTPRYGFAVEICALWYNAVCFACQLAEAFGEATYAPPADPARIAAAFRDRFYLSDAPYLADVVNDVGTDASLRPNQVFAVSLPYSPVEADRAHGIVSAIQDALLTPRGLRTLAPGAPAYRGQYEGPVRERDHAYHQGTVWPWLLGHFGEAYLKTHDWRTEAREFLRNHLNGWLPHLLEAGMGSISEVFDGDPPHRPDGCIAQAWSVAELIRLFSLVDEGPFSCEF